MTWTPDDATVEKAARAMFDVVPVEGLTWDKYGAHRRKVFLDEARAALLAVVPEIVAEAVKAEREGCAEMMRAIPLIGDKLATDIRARHP